MLSDEQVHAYLARIGFSARPATDLETLAALQLAHLTSVPFENLDVFARRSVRTDDEWTFHKVVERRRGGWCFEANGAFAQLLEALGFDVRRLGAAVLLAGPNVTVDHLVLEVVLGEPYLVEVGFGDHAPIRPLPLNARGPLEGGVAQFEFLDSPEGTTLAEIVDGVPEARYRFKRVAHAMVEFDPASTRLQSDRSLHWSTSPFATRMIDSLGTRLTLTRNALKTHRPEGGTDRVPVEPDRWNETLHEHFGIAERFTAAQLARPG